MILQQTTRTIIYMQAKAKYDTKKQVITKRKVTVKLLLLQCVLFFLSPNQLFNNISLIMKGGGD